MAHRDEDFASLLTAGLHGQVDLGLAASAYQHNAERRQAFMAALTDALRRFNLELLSANFGRGVGNHPFWNVTLHVSSDTIRTIRVDLLPDSEPYARATCEDVASRVAQQATLAAS